MARFSPGAVVGSIRGSVGSNVFTRGRSGSTIRIRVKPHNPNSDPQSGVRSYLTAAARAFKALGASDLADWTSYANSITKHNGVSGQSYHPAPIDAFSALAAKFLQVAPGGTIPTSPPATPYVPDSVTLTCAGGSGEVTFTASADQGAGSITEILLQRLPSANRVPSPKGFRTQQFWTADNGSPLTVDHLASDYLHPSSPLPAGTYVPAYRMVKTATGEMGQLHVLPAVTVT